MTSIIPYIAFPGNCKEALRFYAEVFDGEISYTTTFKEAPVEMPPENDDRIFDSEFVAEDLKIKASDNLVGHAVEMGNGISLFVGIKDAERRKKVFEELSENGNIMFPLDDNFGMLKDKFGIQWMIVPEK